MSKLSEKDNNAVIDLGTNSIRMLIFRRNKNGGLFPINSSLRYTRLGQDVSKTGMLSEDAITRNLEALDEYCKIAQDYDVKHIYAFGTNALREAKNSQAFIDKVKERFGLDIHIISGEKEALYGFVGVSQSFKDDNILIFDIGGGSTELVEGRKEIHNAQSLPLGCVRCSDDFIKDQNSVKPEEIVALFDYAYNLVEKTLETYDLPEQFDLIGIGGTITTLAGIVLGLEVYDSNKIHQSIVTFDQMRQLLIQFMNSNLEERTQIVGLPDKRVDTIIAGTTIALAILKASKKTRCRVCDFDNLEGAAYIKFLKENPDSWDHQNYTMI